MAAEHAESGAVEPVPILDRPEAAGFWNVAWPLAMLAIMAALIVQSCVPRTVAPPKFDAVAAAKASNDKAMAGLAALAPNAVMADVVPLLNLMVINFTSGSAAVPADAQPVLTSAARALTVLPAGARVALVGHTDSTGTAENNVALSMKRAEAVRDALVAAGVPAERFSLSGAGDGKPVATNATEQGRFANRRIEFAEAKGS